MNRMIGIRHRVKVTAEGEPSPTQMYLVEEGTKPHGQNLETEDDELDFVRGTLPEEFRKPADDEDLSKFNPRHLRYRTVRKDEDTSKFPESFLRKNDKGKAEILIGVPSKYSGLSAGDIILMTLGGSGDYLAFALSRRASKVGAFVYRVPPFALKAIREASGYSEKDHGHDSRLLIELFQSSPDLFQRITPRDEDLIMVREHYRKLMVTMKDRIACQQRLRQRVIGLAFCSPDGEFPEGSIEKMFDAEKASDPILAKILDEEATTESKLFGALKGFGPFVDVISPVKGVGPRIGARLVFAIGDIRRFATAGKLKKYLGVHVEADGRFPRRRKGELAGWSPDGRQALYLLCDIWNKLPNSEWGMKLRENKAYYRGVHPVAVCQACGVPMDECKKGTADDPGGKHTSRYSDGHIHKMATWRTASQFVVWLHGAWTEYEQKLAEKSAEDDSNDEPKVANG